MIGPPEEMIGPPEELLCPIHRTAQGDASLSFFQATDFGFLQDLSNELFDLWGTCLVCEFTLVMVFPEFRVLNLM